MPALSFVLKTTLAVIPAWAWTDPAVMNHLHNWEAATKEVKSCAAGISLTRTNLLTKKAKTFTGSVILRKPNQARMRLEARPDAGKQADPNDYTTYIWTGTKMYEYDGMARTVTEIILRSETGVLVPKELEPLARLFRALLEKPIPIQLVGGSFTAKHLASRFRVKQIQQDDPNYIYLELTPRSAADKTQCQSITLVLYGTKVPGPLQPYFVRTIRLCRPNGAEVERWEFLELKLNPPVLPNHFNFEEPPANWEVQKAATGRTAGSKQP